jgi:hypothetical protein
MAPLHLIDCPTITGVPVFKTLRDIVHTASWRPYSEDDCGGKSWSGSLSVSVPRLLRRDPLYVKTQGTVNWRHSIREIT